MSNDIKLQLFPELAEYQDLIESTIKPYLKITATASSQTNWWQSKFGGVPYFPKGISYPLTPDGNYLYLLAQINFTEIPHLDNFPQQGILQFYIADDDLYGVDLENMNIQSGFRILYFPELELNSNNIVTDFSFLPTTNRLPLSGDFALEFSLNTAPITACDYQFDQIFADYFADQDSDEYYEFIYHYETALHHGGHRLGGYPYFTQEDPRYRYKDDSEPYLLLLQIDSDPSLDIMWGDMGVGNFFIKESALKNLDFSDVLYNYDCA